MNTYELKAIYDSRASFYGKATVEEDGENMVLKLTSYSTHVATIQQGEEDLGRTETIAEVYGQYSQTTTRHIKEFLKQHGFKADNAKQIMADYGVK